MDVETTIFLACAMYVLKGGRHSLTLYLNF